MKRIALENLSKLYAAIAEKQSLILPIKKAGQTNFGVWTEEAEVDLATLKTVKSAKDAFFPQSENLYTCYRDGKKISIVPEKLEDENFVVFGIKGCDVRGIQVLDKVFLADPVDTFYAARRACDEVGVGKATPLQLFFDFLISQKLIHRSAPPFR